jgi:hypothetical protein
LAGDCVDGQPQLRWNRIEDLAIDFARHITFETPDDFLLDDDEDLVPVKEKMDS